jgi:hypothetical protein
VNKISDCRLQLVYLQDRESTFKEHRLQSSIAGSLISTYRKKNVIPDSLLRYIGSPIHDSTIHATLRLRFCFEIFCLLCLLKPGSPIPATA